MIILNFRLIFAKDLQSAKYTTSFQSQSNNVIEISMNSVMLTARCSWFVSNAMHGVAGSISTLIIIIIIIVIVAFKGAVRDFYSLVTATRTVSNMYTQVARAQSRATH